MSLYVLLTSPVPMPWHLAIRGVAVVLAYFAFAPLGAPSQAVFLSPMKLAVAFGLLASILWNAASALRAIETHCSHTGPRTAYVMWSLLIVAALLAPSDQFLAYAIAAGYAGYAAMVWLLWKGDPETFTYVSWVEPDRPKQAQNTMTWQIWRYLWCAVALLALARHGQPLDWVIGYATLPIGFYYLYWWTIIATHPSED